MTHGAWLGPPKNPSQTPPMTDMDRCSPSPLQYLGDCVLVDRNRWMGGVEPALTNRINMNESNKNSLWAWLLIIPHPKCVSGYESLFVKPGSRAVISCFKPKRVAVVVLKCRLPEPNQCGRQLLNRKQPLGPRMLALQTPEEVWI